MPAMTRRAALAGLATLPVLPRSAAATPRRYHLDAEGSRVGFSFVLNGIAQAGSMPVSRAEILVGPERLAATSVDVSVDVGAARTPLIFATRALKSETVLNAARFPSIRFVSTAVHLAADGRLSGGARLDGLLTLRGRTRPLTLHAALYRARGTEPDDLRHLSVHLTGDLSRRAFGASGFPDLVQDRVSLDILAVIRRI